MRYLAILAVLCALTGALIAPAKAQATRTWVSGVGDDVNPCSRTAPCKTFAGAISKTAAGGEISVLDPGGFGAVTITKSISLVAVGAEGGLLASGTTGILINAGVNDIVSIRGLTIEGGVTGLNGIRILQAGKVSVSDTVIRNFRGASAGRGIDIESTSPIRVYLKNLEVDYNLVGLRVAAPTVNTQVIVDSTVLESNSSNSVVVDGAKASVAAFASRFSGTVESIVNGGKLLSFGNNYITGDPTGTIPLK